MNWDGAGVRTLLRLLQTSWGGGEGAETSPPVRMAMAGSCLRPRTGRMKHRLGPTTDLLTALFFFPPICSISVTPSRALCPHTGEEESSREGAPRSLVFRGRRLSSRLANFPAHKSACKEPSREDAADVPGFVLCQTALFALLFASCRGTWRTDGLVFN